MGEKKRTVWVLDTETKGTGAEMVPLERLEQRKRLRSGGERTSVIAKGKPDAPKDPSIEPKDPPGPRRFKLVSVLSRQVLAEDVGAAEALEVLRDARSVVDVSVYVWQPDESDWRPLTLAERRTLWKFREATQVDRPEPA